LQGAVGWIMVASGLTGDAVYVQPAKLALHFIFAIGLLAYTFWFALQLLIDQENRRPAGKSQSFIILLLLLMTLQLIYGALMAGNKAATAAPTWPDINGVLIPAGMMSKPAGILNLLENKTTLADWQKRTGAELVATAIATRKATGRRVAKGNQQNTTVH